ncbi:MAG: sulfurtransferase TusA [Gammaproteobacteria bacterium]|jgi:tRNA 2-thiouridine synthesizing protein A|tara:strand:+ start:110 stop:346 length:237 start_codon:yes stop_codon:yes gene_type:complete
MKIEIDATGLKCPEPIMLLHKAIRESDDGDFIEMNATDPSTERDVDKFCEFLGHKLLEKKITNENLYFVVQKIDKNII